MPSQQLAPCLKDSHTNPETRQSEQLQLHAGLSCNEIIPSRNCVCSIAMWPFWTILFSYNEMAMNIVSFKDGYSLQSPSWFIAKFEECCLCSSLSAAAIGTTASVVMV